MSLEFKDIGARDVKLGDWDWLVLKTRRLDEVTIRCRVPVTPSVGHRRRPLRDVERQKVRSGQWGG